MTQLAQISTELFQHNILQDILYICLIAFGLSILFYRFTKHLDTGIASPAFFKVDTSYFTHLDIIGVLAIIAVFGATIFLPYKPSEIDLKTHSNLTVLIAFSIPAIFALAIGMSINWRTSLTTAFGLRPSKPVFILIGALIAFTAMIVFMIIFGVIGLENWLESRIGKPQLQQVVTEVINTKDSARLIILIVSACIIAPIVEEIIFRGYIYSVTKKFTGPYFAAIFSGIVFGSIHGNVGAVIALSILGIILAVIYEATGSIWTCILTHTFFNSFSVFMMKNPQLFEKA